MAYTTPITDRDMADIHAENSKAFFNVVDWVRIYDNSVVIYDLLVSLGASLIFDTVAAPTTTTIPTKIELNDMLSNINNVRTWINANFVAVPSDSRNVVLNEAWSDGQSAIAPNFIDVNRWEALIGFLKEQLDGLIAVRFPRTGFALVGSGRTRQNAWRG